MTVDPLAALALAVAGWAAVVARSQLRLQEDASGGRGLSFVVTKPLSSTDRRRGVTTTTDTYRVHVELHGPGAMHEVALHLERDGRQLDPWEPGYVEHPPIVKRMTSTDERLRWQVHRGRGVHEGNGPFDMGHPPDATRKMRRRATPAGDE